MKNVNIWIITLFLIVSSTQVRSQGWQWKDSTSGYHILKDAANELYIFSNNYPNCKIKKLDINGNILWAKALTGNISIASYKMDPSNNLIVVGNIGAVSTIDTYTLVPNGQQSFYILKIAPSGNVLSTQVYGSSSRTFINDLFINSNGDYLIGGGFKGNFNINGSTITGDSLLNAFMVKMNNNGNVLWTEKSTLDTVCPTSGEAWLDEIIESPSGKIYAMMTSACGLIDFNGYQFSSSGQFIMQLDASRNVVWTDYLDYPGSSHNLNSDLQLSGDTVFTKEYIWSTAGSTNKINMWTATGLKSYVSFYATIGMGYYVTNGKIYYAYVHSGYAYPMPYAKIGSLTINFSEISSDSIASPDDIYNEIQFIDPSNFYISGSLAHTGTFFAGRYTMNTATFILRDNECLRPEIYPNPSSGSFTIRSLKEGNYFLINEWGQSILTFKLNAVDGSTVNVGNLKPGIYYLMDTDGQQRTGQKVVITK